MTGLIFATEAPKYYARGIPVIPLNPNSKRPTPQGWSDYADHMITEDIQKYFLSMPANHNIGLVLGKVAGVSVLDFDYADAVLVEKITSLLPQGWDMWKRVGAKGFIVAFRYNPELKTFRIQSREHGTLCEYLSSGTQCVLPPSIHPDTGKPYVANTELLSVIDQLPMLDSDIEDKIRKVVSDYGIDLNSKGVGKLLEVIPAGFRDSKLTQRAGLLAHEVIRGEITVKRAVDMMYSLEADFTQQVVGDAMDMHKHIRNLIKFIIQDLRRTNGVLPIGWEEGLSKEDIANMGLSEFDGEWTYPQIIEKFSVEVDNTRDPLTAVNFALGKMSQIGSPDPIYETDAFQKMIDKSSHRLKMVDLKNKLKKMREERLVSTVVLNEDGEEVSKLDLNTHTEIALAALDRMNSLNPVRVEEGVFYQWFGSHWVMQKDQQIKNFIARQFKKVPLMKRNSDIDGVFKQMANLAEQKLMRDARHFVNVANGILLEDGKFLPHDMDYGATYTLDYCYRPDLAGKMPLFQQFLKDSWGHRADFPYVVQALQEALCATFMGYATKYQRSFLLIGLAHSGKSVLLSIVESLFSDDAKATVAFSKMSDGQMLLSLNKKLINVVGELSEKHNIDGDIFKSVVDGSPLPVRQHYKEVFTMRPVAAHWAASNHLPKTLDSSEGFSRRWLMFHFDHQVPPDKVDVDLANKIRTSEREAIFAWAIEALPRLRQQGYTLSQSHKNIISTLAFKINPVLYFLDRDHHIEIKPGLECTEMDLHYQFRNFHRIKFGSMKNIDIQQFREMLAEGIHARKISRFSKPNDLNEWYSGIGIVQGLD